MALAVRAAPLGADLLHAVSNTTRAALKSSVGTRTVTWLDAHVEMLGALELIQQRGFRAASCCAPRDSERSSPEIATAGSHRP
jgi:hypothetical protein